MDSLPTFCVSTQYGLASSWIIQEIFFKHFVTWIEYSLGDIENFAANVLELERKFIKIKKKFLLRRGSGEEGVGLGVWCWGSTELACGTLTSHLLGEGITHPIITDVKRELVLFTHSPTSLVIQTHWGLVTPYNVGDLGQHCYRLWLVAWRHQAITWTSKVLWHSSEDVTIRRFADTN